MNCKSSILKNILFKNSCDFLKSIFIFELYFTVLYFFVRQLHILKYLRVGMLTLHILPPKY